MGRVLCWLGFHRWAYHVQPKAFTLWFPQERRCERCDWREQATYDMSTGETMWWRVDG